MRGQGHPQREANAVRLEERNALYAFVRGEEVLYIGKTARTIRQRFTGYCRPATSQSTNWRCNGKIRNIIAEAGEVRIFVFTPISHIRYGAFGVNLAAGLEDALIASFDPAWNGREGGKPISEEAEREKAEVVTASGEPSPEPDLQPDQNFMFLALSAFEIKLGEAYYEQGIINPGTAVSELLGAHGDPVQVLFDDGTEPVFSAINRTANRNGSVRLVGRNGQISAWFKKHFERGDVVQASILDPHRIALKSNTKPASHEFYYLDEHGRPADADLHADMLTEEVEAAGHRRERAKMLAEGFDPKALDALFGPEDNETGR